MLIIHSNAGGYHLLKTIPTESSLIITCLGNGNLHSSSPAFRISLWVWYYCYNFFPMRYIIWTLSDLTFFIDIYMLTCFQAPNFKSQNPWSLICETIPFHLESVNSGAWIFNDIRILYHCYLNLWFRQEVNKNSP